MQFILEGGEIEKPIPESTDYPGSNNIPKYIYIIVDHTDYPDSNYISIMYIEGESKL